MPVPGSITDLSTTPAVNSPAGSETPSLIDDYLRTHASFLAQLRDDATKRGFSVAVAGGTADAITATYSPAVAALTNGMTLYVRAALANATTTPTFAPNGLAAATIVRANNQPLVAGDIAGAGHWLELQYDTTLAKWVLQNPARPDLSTIAYVDSSVSNSASSNFTGQTEWINSDFGISQRGLSSLADGAYGPDRTYALTQTASVGYSTLTAPTDGIPFAGRFTQTNAVAQRFGFAQIMEARTTYAYRGVSFLFAPKVRCSAAATIRVALLAHTGTADTLAKDVVNDWTSAAYTAGAFFAAGLTVVDVQSVACLANTWTDVPTGQNIPSSANNLIMLCWTEGAQAQNFTLDASCIRAGRGLSSGLWLPPDPAQERVRVLPFYEKVGGAIDECLGAGYIHSANIARIRTTFSTKRVKPTAVAVPTGVFNIQNASAIHTVAGVTIPPLTVGLDNVVLEWGITGGSANFPGLLFGGVGDSAIRIDAEIGT